jgi:hypothetical protein
MGIAERVDPTEIESTGGLSPSKRSPRPTGGGRRGIDRTMLHRQRDMSHLGSQEGGRKTMLDASPPNPKMSQKSHAPAEIRSANRQGPAELLEPLRGEKGQ